MHAQGLADVLTNSDLSDAVACSGSRKLDNHLIAERRRVLSQLNDRTTRIPGVPLALLLELDPSRQTVGEIAVHYQFTHDGRRLSEYAVGVNHGLLVGLHPYRLAAVSDR